MATNKQRYASPEYWRLDSLQAPVFTSNGPVLALAGPGSGKTRTIIAKAVRLIEQANWDARSVALVTFTRAAAEEMRSRLRKALPGLDLSPRNTYIGTFHGLSNQLLRQHWRSTGQSRKVLTEYEVMSLVSQAAKGFTGKNNALPEIMQSIARYKSLPLDYPFPEVDAQSEHFAIYQAYEKQRTAIGACEINDLVRECLALIRSNTIKPLPVKNMLVDETQDADLAQIDWILAHHAAGVTPTVVADDDQSIFAFRHAAGFRGLQLFAEATGAQILPMTFNYRSGSAIVAAASAVIADSPDRFAKTILPKRETVGSVEITPFFGEADQAHWAVASAGDWLDQHQGSSAAVISRTNAELDLIELACKTNQRPYIRLSSSDFLQREHLSRAMLAIKLLLNPTDAVGFATSAVIGVKLTPAGSQIIQDYFNQNHGTGHVLDLACNSTMLQGLIRDDRTALRTYNEYIADWLDTDPENDQSLNDGLTTLLHRFAAGRGEDTVARDLKFLATMLTGWVKGSLRARMHLLETKPEKVVDKEGAITLCSGHASKGMEFDHVTIINADVEHWPYENTPLCIQEDKRLFYVAMTRPKEHLTIAFTRPLSLGKDTLTTFAAPLLETIGIKSAVIEAINA